MTFRKTLAGLALIYSLITPVQALAQENKKEEQKALANKDEQINFSVDEVEEKLDAFLFEIEKYVRMKIFFQYFYSDLEKFDEHITLLKNSQIGKIEKTHPKKARFLKQAEELIEIGGDFIKSKKIYDALNEDPLNLIINNLEKNVLTYADERVFTLKYLKSKQKILPKQKFDKLIVNLFNIAYEKENMNSLEDILLHIDFADQKHKILEKIEALLPNNFKHAKRFYEILKVEIPKKKLEQLKLTIIKRYPHKTETRDVFEYLEKRKIELTAKEWDDLMAHFLDWNKTDELLIIINEMKRKNILLTLEQKKKIEENANYHYIHWVMTWRTFSLVKNFYEAMGEEIPSEYIEDRVEDIIYWDAGALNYIKKRKIKVEDKTIISVLERFLLEGNDKDAIELMKPVENKDKLFDKEKLEIILNAAQKGFAKSSITANELIRIYGALGLPKDKCSDAFLDFLEHFTTHAGPSLNEIMEKTGMIPSKQRLIKWGEDVLKIGYNFDDVKKIIELTSHNYSEEDYARFANRLIEREMQHLPELIHPIENSDIFHWAVEALKKSKKKDHRFFEKYLENKIYDFEVYGEDVFNAHTYFGSDIYKEIFIRIEKQKEKIKEIENEKQKDSAGHNKYTDIVMSGESSEGHNLSRNLGPSLEKEAFYTNETLLPVEKIYTDLIKEAKYLEKIDEKSAVRLREFLLDEIESKNISEGVVYYLQKEKNGKKYIIEIGDRLLERGAFKKAKIFYDVLK